MYDGPPLPRPGVAVLVTTAPVSYGCTQQVVPESIDGKDAQHLCGRLGCGNTQYFELLPGRHSVLILPPMPNSAGSRSLDLDAVAGHIYLVKCVVTSMNLGGQIGSPVVTGANWSANVVDITALPPEEFCASREKRLRDNCIRAYKKIFIQIDEGFAVERQP
jgi:hypothetical protein